MSGIFLILAVVVTNLPGERWWGGATIFGREQPYANFVRCDQNRDNYCNQISPFFVSSAGRYVWSAKPVAWSVTNGVLTVESAADVELVTAGKTLREAFVAAAKRHFPSDGRIPPEIFFSRPQYNHAIESHVSGRNQVSVERYARISVTTPSPRRPAAGSAVLTTRRRTTAATSVSSRRNSRITSFAHLTILRDALSSSGYRISRIAGKASRSSSPTCWRPASSATPTRVRT